MVRGAFVGVLVVAMVSSPGCSDSRKEASKKAREAAVAAQRRAEETGKAAWAGTAPARKVADRAKAELDKVYRSTFDYDLDITTQGATTTHAAKLAAMPHVQVGNLTVGYEQSDDLSITRRTSRRHFRATWRQGDRDVIVGYQTEATIDLAAFAKLLQQLVPIVTRVIG